PLPVPFAQHVVQVQQRDKGLSSSEAWDRFEERLVYLRRVAYFYMNPFVRVYLAGGVKGSLSSFSTAWFLKALEKNSPEKKPVPAVNLSYWQRRGLLRYREHGVPSPGNAAAFYIASILVVEQLKGFLPSSMEPDEPDWWCWQQSHPHCSPTPSPVPLPEEDLPRATVLWTPWAGASWDPLWLLIGRDRGAIRFAGTSRSPLNGAIRWNVEPEDLLRWEPACASLLKKLPDGRTQPIERQEMLHSISTTVLQQLAHTRLPFPDILPLKSTSISKPPQMY